MFNLKTIIYVCVIVAFSGCASRDYIDPKHERYSVAPPPLTGVVLDSKSNLQWHRCLFDHEISEVGCIGEIELVSWPEAMQTAEETCMHGYCDWRLPTIEELNDFVHCTPKATRGHAKWDGVSEGRLCKRVPYDAVLDESLEAFGVLLTLPVAIVTSPLLVFGSPNSHYFEYNQLLFFADYRWPYSTCAWASTTKEGQSSQAWCVAFRDNLRSYLPVHFRSGVVVLVRDGAID